MRNPHDLLVDDEGRVWHTGSPELLRALHIGPPNHDLTDYLIRNMGFARFRLFRADSRITFQPRFLNEKTFSRLVDIMVEHEGERTLIETVETPGRLEIIPDIEDAAARLAALASDGGNLSRPDFQREVLSLSRLNKQPRLGGLHGLLKNWKSSGGELPSEFSRVFDKSDLLGRTMVIRVAEPLGGIVEHAGNGFTCFGSSWSRAVVGNDLARQPDPKYGQNVAASYLETHLTGHARLEFVEAMIRVPGQAPRRSRYERLLLPWRRGGASFVSVASVLRTSFATASAT